jgi:thymidine kinase
MLKLIPIADKVDKLSAYCSICNNGTLAPFTKRISTIHKDQIDIGSKDKYTAVCRNHYSN